MITGSDPSTRLKIKIISSSNNKTKQPDDIGQLVTYYSCNKLLTAPPSQMHAVEVLISRFV